MLKKKTMGQIMDSFQAETKTLITEQNKVISKENDKLREIEKKKKEIEKNKDVANNELTLANQFISNFKSLMTTPVKEEV